MISGDKLVLSYILGKWGKLPFAMLFHKVPGMLWWTLSRTKLQS
jgi:hypothetical protein